MACVAFVWPTEQANNATGGAIVAYLVIVIPQAPLFSALIDFRKGFRLIMFGFSKPAHNCKSIFDQKG